jgi:hypothetical protein
LFVVDTEEMGILNAPVMENSAKITRIPKWKKAKIRDKVDRIVPLCPEAERKARESVSQFRAMIL